ncbi:SRPBCC family protein [Nocardioides sp. GY 10127]|uniref:SRPBCC family protein n=1 Tax=Nocardioides sp. GY 10127 TaxID=2569762 RepID=UPI0010A75703|nr:SRPBCC family protein [Nocardioides sp. GY 10127]TIC81943.1 polyketide cyclase [Nocardioides sp. GY 10127]
MHVERTFTVRRPLEGVSAYLADFRSTNDWDPGTVETTRTSGDGGVGTTYANTSEFLGRRTSLTYTAQVVETGRLRFEGRNDTAVTHDDLTLTPAGPGSTRIRYRADFDFGRLLNLVAPLFLARPLSALADETVAKMTQVLEEKVPAA